MTGSEIEQAFVEALYLGFATGKEPTDAIIAQSVPLATTMTQRIEALREWARSRARLATSPEADGPERRERRKILSEPGRN